MNGPCYTLTQYRDRDEAMRAESGPDHSYRTPRHVLERIEREYRVLAMRRAGWVARKKLVHLAEPQN